MADLFDKRSIDVLKYAQRMRLELLENVIGEKMPDGKNLEAAKFVLTALKDMERVEIDIAKVRATQSQTDAQTANAAIMAKLMQSLGGQQVRTTATAESYVLPDELEADLIDGEADLEHQSISYDQLVATRDDLDYVGDDEDE